jgi:hypothetical protein
MKKLLFILAILGSIVFESSAYTIIIQGGGKNHQYYRVFANDSRCVCTGNGHNSCLINLGATGSVKTIVHPINDIIFYVTNQVDKGNVNGDVNFENDLPVKWTTSEDGTLEINIDETQIQTMQN